MIFAEPAACLAIAKLCLRAESEISALVGRLFSLLNRLNYLVCCAVNLERNIKDSQTYQTTDLKSLPIVKTHFGILSGKFPFNCFLLTIISYTLAQRYCFSY